MNHFLHKHRYWFIALIVLAVGLMIFFQLDDDEGIQPGPPDQASQQMRAVDGE